MLQIHKEEQEKKEEEAKQYEHYIKALEKYHDRSKDKKEHAIKQFDALLVGISTAGIGFVTLYIKGLQAELLFARISQLAFVFCLFTNLFSHVFSHFANKRVEEIAKDDLEAAKYGRYPKGISKDTFEEHQENRCRKKERFDMTVQVLNIMSFVLLLSAVVTFVIFAIYYPPELIKSN